MQKQDRNLAAPATENPKVRHDRLQQASGLPFSTGAVAWRMLTDLFAGILVGFGVGWGLDQLFTTTPIFLIVVGLLGTAGGIRLAMRTVDELKKGSKDG